jgi:CDP-glucose 4,6-dehydratase
MDDMVRNDTMSFYKDKKVFITGHTGFKGSWLCRMLVLAGADVTGYALLPPPESLFNLLDLGKDVRSITGDIRDYKKLLRIIHLTQPDILFHMAAQPLVGESWRNPKYTYDVNIMGTVNLLEVCRDIPCLRSIVNVTTDKVYENNEDGRKFREYDKLCGHDPYSNSKSCSDIITSCYRQFFNNCSVSTARSGNVIGGGDFSANRIVPDLVRALKEGKPAVIRSPKSIRPYQHVLDCLYGYLLLAEKQYDKKFEGSYNFGPEDFVNNIKLVFMFYDTWKAGMVTTEGGEYKESNVLRLDIEKAKEVLGFNPKWDINKTMEMTVEWYKEYVHKGNVSIDNQIMEFING